MRRHVIYYIMCSLLLFGCSESDMASYWEDVEKDFQKILGSSIDTVQYWETAVRLHVKVSAGSEDRVKVQAYSVGQANTVIYDVKECVGSQMVTLTLPQGMGNRVGLTAVSRQMKVTKSIILNGSQEQTVDVNLQSSHATTRSAFDPSLYGYSILGGAYYNEIKEEVWGDVMSLVSMESVDASTRNEIVNYELVSNGRFEVTFITGFGSSNEPHTLGYYYHSPNTYSDTKLVDIAEVQRYDYLDGMAKTQYMLNSTYKTFNATLFPNVWYDSNFDLKDDPGDGTKLPNVARRNDDAYNSILVWERMGTQVSRIRGLTFVVDVPVGMHIGFYLRLDEERSMEQFNLITKLGMPDNIFPEKYTGYNFSAQAFNYSYSGKKAHRSWIHEFPEFTFMGMENIFDGGDLDCNDIVFGMTATDMDMVLPDVINPDIDNPDDPTISSLPWTIAYEDMHREADFDFNDAVIYLTPDYENHTCNVKVMACGTEDRMYLHYDGPDGDVVIGEMHALLTGNSENLDKVNTLSGEMTVKGKDIADVPWLSEYTMANDARRFYIEVMRGDCMECTDVLRLPESPGVMPEAILVADYWNWPREGVKITDAYKDFKSWSEEVTQMDYWNWYTYPVEKTYVNH